MTTSNITQLKRPLHTPFTILNQWVYPENPRVHDLAGTFIVTILPSLTFELFPPEPIALSPDCPVPNPPGAGLATVPLPRSDSYARIFDTISHLPVLDSSPYLFPALAFWPPELWPTADDLLISLSLYPITLASYQPLIPVGHLSRPFLLAQAPALTHAHASQPTEDQLLGELLTFPLSPAYIAAPTDSEKTLTRLEKLGHQVIDPRASEASTISTPPNSQKPENTH